MLAEWAACGPSPFLRTPVILGLCARVTVLTCPGGASCMVGVAAEERLEGSTGKLRLWGACGHMPQSSSKTRWGPASL